MRATEIGILLGLELLLETGIKSRMAIEKCSDSNFGLEIDYNYKLGLVH